MDPMFEASLGPEQEEIAVRDKFIDDISHTLFPGFVRLIDPKAASGKNPLVVPARIVGFVIPEMQKGIMS
ncbi:hypothetical protein SESBI_47761 [Sesbania bispinosa]|nr:hypothetical protein SESBI_47761 [Sesbania bispinosa]